MELLSLRSPFVLCLSFLFLITSKLALAANTYISQDDVAVLVKPNGKQAAIWPKGTTFTGTALDEYWIEISGVVAEGMWQPLDLHRYVATTAAITLKPNKQHGSKTIIYKALTGSNGQAKTYRVVGDTIAYLSKPDSKSTSTETELEYETWINSKEFTSAYQDAEYIKATGNISELGWQPFAQPRWIRKPAPLQDITLPKPFTRNSEAVRIALVDKSSFHLVLYEVVGDKVEKLMKTPVALGYDKCLPAEKGGQCYYTPEGQFTIDFKLFDPSGIQWCIPQKMRGEFKEQLARGENCWRGIMGRHALHFGDSLFLHGTSNPSSIGSKTTHGCVRLRNADIDIVYRLMTKGDKVVVSATPDSIDLVELAKQTKASKAA